MTIGDQKERPVESFGGCAESVDKPGVWRTPKTFLERARSAVRRRFRSGLVQADRVLARLLARRSWLSSFYFLVFSCAFRRENQATLAGRNRYASEERQPRESSVLIRRNVHRLEKGLVMRPRREVFALDYLEETVAGYRTCLEVAKDGDGVSSDELQWAHDVLAMYFEVVASHPKINPLWEQFRSLPVPRASNAPCFVPYRRDLTCRPSVTYDALLELAERRRSVRWFLPKPVPRELVDKAILVAGLSPSACNRQPFVFRVFDDPESVRKVANLPYGTAGYAENIPVMIVVVGRLRSYFDERDRHLIYVDGALASMSLLYACEVQGLSTCCINWPDVEEREREMAKMLDLEPDERAIMLIAVGYPDPEGMVACSRKKPLEQLRRYNFE